MDTDVERVEVIGVAVKRKVVLPPCGYYCIAHPVLNEVIVEIGARGQAENQISDLGLRIVDNVPGIPHRIIPMIAAHEFLELERIARERRVNGPDTFR